MREAGLPRLRRLLIRDSVVVAVEVEMVELLQEPKVALPLPTLLECTDRGIVATDQPPLPLLRLPLYL